MLARFTNWLQRGGSGALASALVLTSAAFAACSAPAAEAPADMAVLPPDLTLVDLKAAGYPAGPTGPNIGDVVPDFTFQGFWSPTKTTGLASTETWGEVNFDMLRTSGAKYALIQTAAFW